MGGERGQASAGEGARPNYWGRRDSLVSRHFRRACSLAKRRTARCSINATYQRAMAWEKGDGIGTRTRRAWDPTPSCLPRRKTGRTPGQEGATGWAPGPRPAAHAWGAHPAAPGRPPVRAPWPGLGGGRRARARPNEASGAGRCAAPRAGSPRPHPAAGRGGGTPRGAAARAERRRRPGAGLGGGARGGAGGRRELARGAGRSWSPSTRAHWVRAWGTACGWDRPSGRPGGSGFWSPEGSPEPWRSVSMPPGRGAARPGSALKVPAPRAAGCRNPAAGCHPPGRGRVQGPGGQAQASEGRARRGSSRSRPPGVAALRSEHERGSWGDLRRAI